MIRSIVSAYITFTLTLFFGLIVYTIVIDEILKPLLLSTFFPYAAVSHNPQKHIAADTICTYAKSLSDSATSKLLTRLFRETSQAIDMEGWFSKTEVIIINNGTSCVEYHVENLVVGGVILVMCLACVTAKCYHMSRSNSIRRSCNKLQGRTRSRSSIKISDHLRHLRQSTLITSPEITKK